MGRILTHLGRSIETPKGDEPKNKTEMKEINGYLLVEVPETTNISKLRIGQPDLLDVYGDEFGGNTIQLPEGNYSIIGLAKDLTEEQWNNMVDNNQLGCFDNYRGKSDERYTCQTATESGHSLLKANNLNPDNCLILKNENR